MAAREIPMLSYIPSLEEMAIMALPKGMRDAARGDEIFKSACSEVDGKWGNDYTMWQKANAAVAWYICRRCYRDLDKAKELLDRQDAVMRKLEKNPYPWLPR